ncbi:glutathione S-transferase 1-like [Haliotis rubra]|uniref:glutathione S-transferase 1-like n=1 Tax=Haliotis rubra TaxID=36100 RepID=UPI001EE4FB96|nr:glutathione S-transferase 1-like [Haliotis rubra]
MANIQVYHFIGSPPSQAVIMTAKTLGVPLELKRLDFMKKEHLQPEFTKINPDQTVPTMIDEDFILWESRTIMRYLVGKFGGEDNSLYPRDLQKRAEVDRLLDYDLGVFYKTLIEGVWLPFKDRTPKTKEQEEKVTKVLSRFDTLLKDKKFLTGDNLTIADFSMVVGFIVELVYEGDKSKFPNAMAWYKRMQEETCFKETYDTIKDFVEMMKKQHAEMP